MTRVLAASLRRLVRQSLVVLVLFSTLATTFGFTNHSQAASGADTVCVPAGHGTEECLAAGVAMTREALAEHGESDPCDHCHCQFPTIGFPSGMPNWAAATGQPCAHEGLIVIRPDGHSFAPEPPPIRA